MVAGWYYGTSITITEKLLDAMLHFYPKGDMGGLTSTISNIQIEEGSVATPYVPYGNIYLPQGNE